MSNALLVNEVLEVLAEMVTKKKGHPLSVLLWYGGHADMGIRDKKKGHPLSVWCSELVKKKGHPLSVLPLSVLMLYGSF